MKKLGDLMMILDLHRQGVRIAAIARQVGIDRKTVRKYIGRALRCRPTVLANRANACLILTWVTCERVWKPIQD